jgi:uncharacterized protein (TIGR03083 family)
MLNYLNAIVTESARFADVLRDTPGTSRVPSCPDWSMSDLGWHLAEVQYFWASIVENLFASPEAVPDLERPEDTELSSLFDIQSTRLVAALQARNPDDECWSWYQRGANVGWVRRRQAHEALIHRVDAELTEGSISPIDEDLAADGVDEILTTMLDSSDIPDWSRFEPDGTTAAIASPHRTWTMVLGRFIGTSPVTGNMYDDPAVVLQPIADIPTVTISGPGTGLDLWLWGRGNTVGLGVEGDPALLDVIRAAAAAATQ